MIKNKHTIHKTIKAAGLFVVLFLLVSTVDLVFFQKTANTQPIDFAAQSSCGSGSGMSTTLETPIVDKQIYIKLAGNGTPQNVTIYKQSIDSSDCIQLGSVVANSDTWVQLPFDSNALPEFTTLLVDGAPLSSDPYAPAAQLLFVDPTVCTPVKDCVGTYNNQSVIFEPNKVGTSGVEFIRILEVNEITATNVSKVEYYSNNEFRYSSPVLEAFDQRYLDGGKHNLKRVVYFENGQKITMSESVDMGATISVEQWLMSWYYRLGNEIKVVVSVLGVIVIVFTLASITRFIYKKHRFNKNHGF